MKNLIRRPFKNNKKPLMLIRRCLSNEKESLTNTKSFSSEETWLERYDSLNESSYFGDARKHLIEESKDALKPLKSFEKKAKKLIKIKESLKKINSVLDLEKRRKKRSEVNLPDNTFKQIYDPHSETLNHLRQEFIDRIEDMGINAKGYHDNEMRFEALKRSYLRYRRKRKYQQLLEIGLTNRRPRVVTEKQYLRFKEYLRTGKYPYGREKGPSYIKDENGIFTRIDVYERKTNVREKLERLDYYRAVTNSVKAPADAISVGEALELKDFSRESLGEILRKRKFESYERKLEWLFSTMAKLKKSEQAFEALIYNIELRSKIISDYDNNRELKEYYNLREKEEFKNLFKKPECSWEKNALRGLLLYAIERRDFLEAKRLALKSEVDNSFYDHKDKHIASLCHKMRRDRELDKDENNYLNKNPIKQRLVVNSNLLQRKQRILANPDLFMRFDNSSWRFIEKEILNKITERESAESDGWTRFGYSFGVHRNLWSTLDHPTSKQLIDREDFAFHKKSFDEYLMHIQIRKWATGILNGIEPGPNKTLNTYIAQQIEKIGSVLGDNYIASLLVDPFPYGEVDMEPLLAESQYLMGEYKVDQRFAKHIVKWFLSPNLERKMGYSYNPFRYFVAPKRLPESYVWKELPEKDDKDLEVEGRITKMFVNSKTVSHSEKHGRVQNKKITIISGNRNKLVGFTEGGEEKSSIMESKVPFNDMMAIPLFRSRSLHHSVEARWKGSNVKIIATPPGYGLIGPPLLRSILVLAGIKDATIFQFGNKNQGSLIRACILALGKLRDVEEVSWTRGIPIEDVLGDADRNTFQYAEEYNRRFEQESKRYLMRFEDTRKSQNVFEKR